ncbi:hypothetical protein [Amnibacterium kyonggiense]|uniref:hypothetical protein n=1 Tax=Amnibacterium kyonggiense TaxID=595671 RepID=UPI00105DFA76|nr:hypothetical protein [Amnibacterium kyonggiense]
MERRNEIVPMSDRRLVLAVVGVLTAALGLAVLLLSLLALRHPVGATGDLGTPTDLGFLYRDLMLLGGVLLLAGAGTAVALVRAQLRPDRRRAARAVLTPPGGSAVRSAHPHRGR